MRVCLSMQDQCISHKISCYRSSFFKSFMLICAALYNYKNAKGKVNIIMNVFRYMVYPNVHEKDPELSHKTNVWANNHDFKYFAKLSLEAVPWSRSQPHEKSGSTSLCLSTCLTRSISLEPCSKRGQTTFAIDHINLYIKAGYTN